MRATGRGACLLCVLLLIPGDGLTEDEREANASRRAAILAPTTQFDGAERWEELSGGTATNRKRFDRKAFSQFSSGLSFEEQANFHIGDGLFRRPWVSAPSSTRAADGLGPLYNARACQSCHLQDGRGHPPPSPDKRAVSMLVRLSIPDQDSRSRPDPVYGHQLQDIALPGHQAEGRLRLQYQDYPVPGADGETLVLHRPEYQITALAYGPLHPEIRISPRVAQPMIGLGLLEAIAESDILAHADPEDRNQDGISGRPNLIENPQEGRRVVGRFGWKARQVGLREQTVVALSQDMGLSTEQKPALWGDCTATQVACRTAPHGGDVEDGNVEVPPVLMELFLAYVRNLAVPARRRVDDAKVLRGKQQFYGAGCIGCHVPKWATRRDYPISALAGQLIWPYTDLLLHDMGDGLADAHVEGEAQGREWRTPPLWGIGLTQEVSGHTRFLHDGRARNLLQAIAWHGGEAQESRDAFFAMSQTDREAVITFLESL